MGESLPGILDRAAAADTAELRKVGELVDRVCIGTMKPTATAASCHTFGDVADAWTSGELAKQYPHHLRQKRTAKGDELQVARHMDRIRDVPIRAFTLDHAELVMGALPDHLEPGSRRQVAQTVARVMKLAAFPLRLIATSPIPTGWLPRVSASDIRKQETMFPHEADAFVSCAAVPMVWRMLAGFIAREGMRRGEVLRLTWSDIDLERGLIRLDENKTDDARSWVLRPGVARALARWHVEQGKPGPDEPVFPPPVFSGAGVKRNGVRVRGGGEWRAEDLRRHLLVAGVDRKELHDGGPRTKESGLHSLRALFVTEALARGESETWVADRTGHRSSQMINAYRRRARSWGEATLAPLGELDVLLGWSAPEAPADRDPEALASGSRRRQAMRPDRKEPRTPAVRYASGRLDTISDTFGVQWSE